jgi:hypothetical protein
MKPVNNDNKEETNLCMKGNFMAWNKTLRRGEMESYRS